MVNPSNHNYRSLFSLWLLIVVAGLSLTFSPRSLAEVSASLEREQISITDTVRLIIKSDDTSSGAQPDFSVLKQNFNILGTSVSQNVSIINGVQTAEKSWITQIEPKLEGSFTIPPITVGNEQTRSLRLTVLPENTNAPNSQKDVFIEFELDKSESYVQQQVIATVRLFLGVNLINGSLTDPVSEKVNVIRIGKDAQFSTTIDGRPYRVIERQYAFFPSASGEISIDPVRFKGLGEDPARKSFGSLFDQGTPLSGRSQSVTLWVKPPATDFKGRTWLPAKALELIDVSENISEIELGQPITLQIQINAVGLSADQLPVISIPESESFKQYPDKPAGQTGSSGKDITSTSLQSIAIIPSKSGELVIPKIEINWWDIVGNKIQTAVLPEKRITISPSTTTSIDATESNDAQQSLKNGTPSSLNSQGGVEPIEVIIQDPTWRWISLALLLGWVATSLYFLRRIRSVTSSSSHNTTITNEHSNLAQLQELIVKSCRNHNPESARRSLLDWAYIIWPEKRITGLVEIADLLPASTLKTEVRNLDKSLYSNNAHETDIWDGESFSAAFYQYLRSQNTTKKPDESTLPELYPTKTRSI